VTGAYGYEASVFGGHFKTVLDQDQMTRAFS
jgi:hypothetical protein